MSESLSEVLRPTELADLIQPQHIIDSLQRMIEKGRILNMLFYGRPGVGKTSAAKIICAKLKAHVWEVNGSTQTGIETVRDIQEFCRNHAITGEQKICLIDECEYLSANAQAGLRGVIENSYAAPFLLTANNATKLSAA